MSNPIENLKAVADDARYSNEYVGVMLRQLSSELFAELSALSTRLADMELLVRAMLSSVVKMRATEKPITMMGPCGANDAGKTIGYTVSAIAMSELNDSAVALQQALESQK